MLKNIKKKDLIVFSLIWAFIFVVIGLFPLLSGNDIRDWSLIVSLAFVILIIVNPIAVVGFYNAWIKVGEFAGGIISKVIMFILYFCLFTPVSLFLKILGKDLLRKKMNKRESSYWIQRETQPQSMKKQF